MYLRTYNVFIFRWINCLLLILKQKYYLFESPSACWVVYIPPYFVFSTYDRSFRT